MTLPDYLAELNPDQLKAAQTLQGPVLIQAGAGSGKTKTVIARIHNLIDHGINPEHILAITFTNKAAQELKNRLPESGHDVKASTIHAFCAFVLRRLPHLQHFDSAFMIIDSSDQKDIIRQTVEDYFINEKPNLPEELKKQYRDLKPKTEIEYISKAKYDAHRGSNTRAKFLYKSQLTDFTDFYEAIYKYYTNYLLQHNAMDFDDLLYNTVKLFKEHPEDLKLAQEQYQYISVDEYQDVSDIQEELISMIANTPDQNICVVGDPNQSIYAFRGAKVQNILNFKKKYPNAKVITIMHNYRSTQSILDVANEVISHNRKAMTVNPELDAVKSDGPKPIVVQNYNDYEESTYVITKIKERIAAGVQPNEIAILYRNNSISRLFEQDLVENNIRYNVVGALNFYERKEIKDLVAYLRLIANKQDDLSFKRIINTPSRHIGTTTINYMTDFANSCNPKPALFKVAQYADQVTRNNGKKLGPATIQSLKKFTDYIMQFDLQQKISIYDVLTKICQDFYLKYVTTLDEHEKSTEGTRVDNVQQLISAASEFGAQHPDITLNDALIQFLQQAVLNTNLDANSDDKVQLMTVHSAKGLEFDTVFVVALEEQIFPSSYATKKTIPEERRLFYVAITRAKRELYLTYANERSLWGRTQVAKRSRFLSDINPADVTQINNDHYAELKTNTFKPGKSTPIW